jgi:hypothetical protein
MYIIHVATSKRESYTLCQTDFSLISCFHCDVNEILALLGCYTAQIVVTNVLGKPIGPIFKSQAV